MLFSSFVRIPYVRLSLFGVYDDPGFKVLQDLVFRILCRRCVSLWWWRAGGWDAGLTLGAGFSRIASTLNPEPQTLSKT